MSRINTNVQSLVAQRVLGMNNKDLSRSLERLSTGLRINRGADDPAGLIASQNLRAEKKALGAAIGNAERAEQVVNIAEGGLQEISNLLVELEGLVTNTANEAGLSVEEKEANQLQIDSILHTIDRVAGATSFQGRALLNGNFDYTSTSIDGEVSSYQVNGAKLNYNSTLDVDVLVTGSAQNAGVFLSTGGALDLTSAGSSFTIEIAGVDGSRELSFSSGATLADIASTINTFSDVTGVTATASAGAGIRLDSNAVGSSQFVSVKVIDDGGQAGGIRQLQTDDTAIASGAATTFSSTAAGNGLTDDGQDVSATINGIAAVTDGSTVSINTDFLSAEINLTTGGSSVNSQNLGSISAFTITGGGADFQLASNVDIAGKVSLGIQNVAARTLGRVTDGSNTYTLADLGAGKDLNVENGDLTQAQKVVAAANRTVSALRGRLGAFQQNTIGATVRSLGISLENTTAAESSIRDADFASETAAMTRAQILVSSTTSVLSISNSSPQNVLQLLG